jgi:hypothetical protein
MQRSQQLGGRLGPYRPSTQQPWLAAGFVTRSIVALTFSCISAVVGIVFLIAYDLSDLKFHNELPTATAVDENTPKERRANNCDWRVLILVLFLSPAGTADSRNQDFYLTLLCPRICLTLNTKTNIPLLLISLPQPTKIT